MFLIGDVIVHNVVKLYLFMYSHNYNFRIYLVHFLSNCMYVCVHTHTEKETDSHHAVHTILYKILHGDYQFLRTALYSIFIHVLYLILNTFLANFKQIIFLKVLLCNRLLFVAFMLSLCLLLKFMLLVSSLSSKFSDFFLPLIYLKG